MKTLSPLCFLFGIITLGGCGESQTSPAQDDRQDAQILPDSGQSDGSASGPLDASTPGQADVDPMQGDASPEPDSGEAEDDAGVESDAALADSGPGPVDGGPTPVDGGPMLINECTNGTHDCDVNADCTDLEDGYACDCQAGFNGDGQVCADIDECAMGNGGCEQVCINEAGGFSCACTPGYELNVDGVGCDDIDECALDNGGCDQTCTNFPGDFACCAPTVNVPPVVGCDGVILTSPEVIEARSDGVAAVPGPGAAQALRIDNGASMDVIDEGCVQLGRDGQDFGLSFWFKTSGNQNGEYMPGGQPQIIGTKSQYGGPQGFVILSRLMDGQLEINAHSSLEDERRNVRSVPFEVDTWTHVVVNYRNDGANSTFSLHVNMVRTSGAAQPNVHNENLRIGDQGWGEMPPFEIAAFQSYGRVLDESEIRSLFLQHADGAGVSAERLGETMARLSAHIAGDAPLDAPALQTALRQFPKDALLLSTDDALMTAALDLVDLYEDALGPLFLTEATRGGFSRHSPPEGALTLDQGMLAIQQAIMDQVFTGDTVDGCRALLAGRGWQTANYFPGSAEQPEEPNLRHPVTIKADAPPFWGRPVAYASDPVRRPTGFYLPPGSVGHVMVPPEMVNSGFRVLIGAHTSDHANKSTHKRLDRVTTSFPITGPVTYVANPLGGGVYIMVPYLAELGLTEIELAGVIEAPFFSMRSFDETTPEEWIRRRTAPAPWADFETDTMMMQLPRSWIFALEDPHSLIAIWDRALNSISEYLAYPPEERNRSILYHQVDVHIRHGAFGIGYPQVNNTYDPYADGDGNQDHWILRDPLAFEVEYHEIGHAQLMSMFPGETESIVNFLHAYIRNVEFDVDFDTAFRQSFGPAYGNVGYTPDDAAIHWMITDNFRSSAPMDRSNTTRDEFRYQQRGYAKYADIARLFDWQTLRDFHRNEHLAYMAGEPDDGLEVIDSRILRLSIAADSDLTPLIHFWGIHPVEPGALQAAMVMHGLGVSPVVRDQLIRYADIAPANNAQFNAHYERVYPGRPAGGHPDYGTGWYNGWRDRWDDSHGAAIRGAIQELLNRYYPE